MNGHNWHIPETLRLYAFPGAGYADPERVSGLPPALPASGPKVEGLEILAFTS